MAQFALCSFYMNEYFIITTIVETLHKRNSTVFILLLNKYIMGILSKPSTSGSLLSKEGLKEKGVTSLSLSFYVFNVNLSG